MSNKLKNMDIKNWTYCFLDDMINIKNFDSNKIKTDKKSYRNILVYYIGYVKVLSYTFLAVILIDFVLKK